MTESAMTTTIDSTEAKSSKYRLRERKTFSNYTEDVLPSMFIDGEEEWENIFDIQSFSTDTERENSTRSSRKEETQAGGDKCVYCCRTFASTYSLALHIGVKHKDAERSFKCDICFKSFTLSSQLAKHRCSKVSDGSNPVQCDLCSRWFPNNLSLGQHRRYAHPSLSSSLCSICNEDCRNQKSLAIHLHAHEREFKRKCCLCDEIFPSEALLDKHIGGGTHTGQNFICYVCDSSVLPCNIKQHMIKHSYLYQCEKCQRGFSREYTYINHTCRVAQEIPKKKRKLSSISVKKTKEVAKEIPKKKEKFDEVELWGR